MTDRDAHTARQQQECETEPGHDVRVDVDAAAVVRRNEGRGFGGCPLITAVIGAQPVAKPSSAVVTPTPWLRYGISTCRAESTRENARSSGLSVPVT